MTRVFAAFLISMLPLAAQTSSLQGLVTDGQSSAVPDAIVTATNAGTSAVRKTLTNATGAYSLLQMAPGSYKIGVEKPGFRSDAAEIDLLINTPATLNVRLTLGAVTETVNVMAEGSAINTQNAAIGSPFNETQVKELPLQTRNVVALLGAQAGVSSSGQVLGSRPDQNNVLLDGVDVNDNQGANGFNAVLPIPLDSVQEFRTTVAGLGADLGRSGGGQVFIVTKGGSNQFHGSAYEYNRNTLTEANDWFSNRAGVPRSALVRNQYGASLGGPVLKNRVFFFFNYEARKDRSASSKTATVPTSSFAAGNVQVLLKDGRTVTLTPQDVIAIDPQHIGTSSYVLNLMKQYPAGNNPLGASDKGLNFNQLLFNAPNTLDNHVMVARMDYNIDSAGKHSIMARGTLNGAGQDSTLAQFPGQSAVARTLDNSRGLALRYTTVITPRLVNLLSYGYTRLGTSATGNQSVIPSIGFTTLTATPRPSQRHAPTTNITDDLTWSKGRHTVQAGINFRFNNNDRMSFNNLPSYSFSRNTLLGLGADINAGVLAYLQPTYGSGIALSSGTNVTNAFGALLGLINQYGATYNFGKTGTAIPFEQPVTVNFGAKEYEAYAQDSFKWKRNLTVTYGIRYSVFGVPYERTGLQVVPTTNLSQYFAERNGGQLVGIPSSSLPSAFLTYALGGPANKKPGYYPTAYNNWAPRLSVAYTPDSGSIMEKIMGKGSAFRAGGGIAYDHYGSAMVANFASSGSPGLASTVAQPVNTNFTTGFRYTGSALPTLPVVSGGAFPYTPPLIQGGFTTFSGVSSDLKAPYSYLLNASYSRPLTRGITLELGYAGRLSHRGLLNQDFAQPMTKFTDSKSGQSWTQASIQLANLYNSGLTSAQVKANPALVPTQPFFENIFGASKNQYITGSASANFFYDVYGNYSGSYLDGLNDMDRIRLANGTCIASTGCNTFFPMQNSGLDAYVNAGKAAYHAATVVVRRAVSHGWGYDFNYTFSHGLDNGSASETSGGAALQDAFNPNAFRGPSDFDARHTISANAVVEIPVGKGKAILGHIPTWLDYAIGGWQASTLYTFRTGLPLNCTDSGVYNVNYDNSAYCVVKPGSSLPVNGFTFDSTGIPSIFANTNAVNSVIASNPGQVGTRGMFRGPRMWTDDISVSKVFKLPKEGHRIQIRAEAYNAFNHENFGNPSLNMASPTTFGEITASAAVNSATSTSSTTPNSGARVMQFALRYEF